MQSRAFSLISVVVSTLLLAALIFVILLAVRDNPAIALRTLATLTPSTPRSSGLAGGSSDAVEQAGREGAPSPAETLTPAAAQLVIPQLDRTRRVESAGFAFRPLVGYTLEEANGSITMQGASGQGASGDAGGAGGSPGAVFVLSGGAPEQFVSGAASDLEATFDRFVEVYAERDKFEVGGRSRIILDGAPGLAVDLRGDPTVNPFAGKIAMVEPQPNRLFLMIGVAPAEEWNTQVAVAFASVLASVTFLGEAEMPVSTVATSTLPTATPLAATDTPVPPTEEPRLATATPTPPATATATETIAETATETPAATSEPTETATPEQPTPDQSTPEATANATARGVLGGALGGSALGGSTPTPTLSNAPTTDTITDTTGAQATPTRGPEVRRRVYSNGNYGNDVSIMRSTLWSATGGGVIAWNKTSGSYVKFTTLDGLVTNHLVAAAACPLPGFGVIFGTDQGLQIFDTQNGSWKVFSSANSPMSYDDIVDIYCEPAYNFLVVAYARHGLDIYDADSGQWTHVDQSDGLESDNIRNITVVGDRQSIWVASSLGAAVYGRNEATLYTPENSPLDSANILALAGDGSETVWLSTGQTLYRSNGRDWSAYSAATSPDFPRAVISAIGVAGDGTVWLGSESGEVCAFDPVSENCDALYQNEEGMVEGPITSINVGTEGDVYYTTAGAGIGMFAEGEWRSLVLPSEPLPGNRVRGIIQAADPDDSGAIWIATDGGIASISEDGSQVLSSLTPGANAIATGPEGELWIGGQGAAYFDGDTWVRYNVADGLAGADVTAIAVDEQQRTWIGTTTGLSIWAANTFVNLTTENGLPSDEISALAVAGDLVWIGTSNGLLRFRDNQLRVYNTSNVDLPGNAITALAVDEDGSLLVGTDRGLARFSGDSAFAIPGVPSVEVTAIAVGGGRIWVATASPDLLVFDGSSWQPFTEAAYLPSPRIRTLYLDRGGALWVGGETGGLLRYVP